MPVQAKMKCTQNGPENEQFRTVVLVPVYSQDPASPNYTWSKWTPSGEVRLAITNPGAFDQFVVGTEYLLTFEAIPAAVEAPPAG